MISDKQGAQLHDRATRGEELTPAEQEQLAVWYAGQDSAERDALPLEDVEDVAALQTQVQAATKQLAIVTGRIQGVTAENETLRREITALRQRLATPA
jgi:hypothetical protein